MMPWILIGVGAYVAVVLFVLALCKAASDADDALERELAQWHEDRA